VQRQAQGEDAPIADVVIGEVATHEAGELAGDCQPQSHR
jgi:hypothetical protein